MGHVEKVSKSKAKNAKSNKAHPRADGKKVTKHTQARAETDMVGVFGICGHIGSLQARQSLTLEN